MTFWPERDYIFAGTFFHRWTKLLASFCHCDFTRALATDVSGYNARCKQTVFLWKIRNTSIDWLTGKRHSVKVCSWINVFFLILWNKQIDRCNDIARCQFFCREHNHDSVDRGNEERGKKSINNQRIPNSVIS